VESLWTDGDAARAVAHYHPQGVNEDLALRVYTTRLLGGVPSLVLHGGGNTSVKTRVRDAAGDEVEVLCVKGSGWDMAAIEPPGLPAVRLAPLRRLIALDGLGDADMVNAQRSNLLDASAPNPSVETLLHAFLPHKFIDHTHANAVLAITDQPDGVEICREVYGDRAALVPYIMPGFALAKKAAEVHAENPETEGLILLKHGIFSYGATAREAYERMIALVGLAEERAARGPRKSWTVGALPRVLATPAAVAPILRGLLARPIDPDDGVYARFILEFRGGDAVRDFVAGAELGRYGVAGPVTPDHAIRTKPWPVILPAPEADDLDGFATGAAAAIRDYEARYRDYFERNNARLGGIKTRLDAAPRVLLVPGLGLFAAGASAQAARIAADLAETNVAVILEAEAIGAYHSIPEPDLFEIEYWSLEQAKLGKAQEKPLARQVAVVTGGAGAIGLATAKAFKAQGAEVALLDLDRARVAEAAGAAGGIGIACDVTDADSLRAAFEQATVAFGGVDILVSNAGAAWQGRIGEVSEAVLRESFELNFFAHQRAAQAAVAIMRRQKTGGVLLFNTSKQAVNPGPDFGPYGLPKAATLFLSRQYALDHGADGIRSNAVNADRVQSGLLTEAMIASRAQARGLSEADYLRGNLLHREVRAEDVAKAFVDLALSPKTTGAVLTVDGGNIAAALR
jgi:rhamnose utilization protein RhaD (predicted bifunctional aldolase and dehydrogenase)/NAD(P)-dependent dehydrogenase (short-subunit alcohol dehydrogenase family)